MGEILKIDASTATQSTPQQTSTVATTQSVDMESAKKKCLELGFKIGTDTFGQCILKLTK